MKKLLGKATGKGKQTAPPARPPQGQPSRANPPPPNPPRGPAPPRPAPPTNVLTPPKRPNVPAANAPKFEAGGIALPKPGQHNIQVQMSRGAEQGNYIGITRAPGDNLFTVGMTDCSAVVTITPHGNHTLTHLQGGRAYPSYFEHVRSQVTKDTTVIIAAGGNNHNPQVFDSMIADAIRDEFKKWGVPAGNFKVIMPTAAQVKQNMCGFVVLGDGRYGFSKP
ncbi:uncharacterized protein AB675_10011 [Cyphellophora attinorum]|uniref:Uncharacterized protein n=1 Tax=Cyphellophora attinorum TaxID=1664694 RepID=A0A0N1HJN5_9EURO|nr:uncharacterized protein AB675_10011 [Phialophora attinorum]KPI36727.1 hypothetical protein AB675_10011 [Phialophora attinorum]